MTCLGAYFETTVSISCETYDNISQDVSCYLLTSTRAVSLVNNNKISSSRVLLLHPLLPSNQRVTVETTPVQSKYYQKQELRVFKTEIIL